ncbi:MAG: hypothetical protein K6E37_04260 [Bacteroidales bacterium]|nr:hypothetical protein [Bacteroidales bacterium]
MSEERHDYFAGIIRAHFPGYTVMEYVPVAELTRDAGDIQKLYIERPEQVYRAEWGQPYEFVLYADGAVKAVVVSGLSRSHNSNAGYLVARMFAKKLNVPYIGFYGEFSNGEDYVVSRIRERLEG